MVILPHQWRVQPWKNGRGTTSEVLRYPDRDEYEFRLSVAEVTESGPFSTFPGYKRWTLRLGGGPIKLNGVELLDQVFEIDGNAALDAQVEAPARLLNIVGKSNVDVIDGDDADVIFDCKTMITAMPSKGYVIGIRR